LQTVPNRSARERLSRHLMKIYTDGEQDEHRLTVHRLSYPRDLDREIDSRTKHVGRISEA
jgi:hypothetical protein